MKIANVNSMVAKGMLATVVAGALMIASPAKANAEQFGVGVVVGYPHRDFDRRDYDRRDFDRRQDFLRHEEWERRQAFLRHEEWERAHRFYGRDYR
jgi:hypothetical protein